MTQIREDEIIKTGRIVGMNKNPKAGHFYLMPNSFIYRAMPNRDTQVYPVITQFELNELIKKGIVYKPKVR